MTQLNRSDDLTYLYDQVMLRTPLLLDAPDGMGKTHLLQQLIQKLQGRRVCFYISLKGYISFPQFLNDWVEELIRVSAVQPNLQYQLKRFLDEYGINKINTPEEVLSWSQQLVQMLSQVALDFLFLFEDLDEWEAQDDYEGISQLLTNLSEARNIQWLISANHFPTELAAVKGLDNYRLKPIPEENIWPQGATTEQQEAYRYSDGHTGLLLHLLQYLESENQLQKATQQMMRELHPRMKLFKNRFTGLQWKLMRAIALEERVAQPHAFDFLVQYRLGAASSVERALRNLTDSGIITRTEEGYELTSVIHKRWLQWLYSSSFH